VLDCLDQEAEQGKSNLAEEPRRRGTLSRLAMESSIVNEVRWLSVLLRYALYPMPVGSGPAHAIRYAVQHHYPVFSSHALFLF
jgi:hypothetical protein